MKCLFRFHDFWTLGWTKFFYVVNCISPEYKHRKATQTWRSMCMEKFRNRLLSSQRMLLLMMIMMITILYSFSYQNYHIMWTIMIWWNFILHSAALKQYTVITSFKMYKDNDNPYKDTVIVLVTWIHPYSLMYKVIYDYWLSHDWIYLINFVRFHCIMSKFRYCNCNAWNWSTTL